MFDNPPMSLHERLLTLAPVLRTPWERLRGSPMGYRLVKGAFWSLGGSLVSRGLALLSGILVARLLGKHDFGQLGMIQSTVGMFGILAGFGMGLTATKHVAELRWQNPTRAGRIIGLSSLVSWVTGAAMTLVLLLAAPWVAKSTLASPEMTALLRAGAPLLVLGGVNGAQTGALSGFEAFKKIAQVNLASGLLSFPITVMAAWWFGVEGAVWANVFSLGANCCLNYCALRGEANKALVPLGYRGSWQEWSVLWSFSLPAVIGSALVSPVAWAANAMLVNQPGGYAELGVYNAALRIKQVPELALAMLMAPLLPVLSEQFGRGSTQQFRKTLRYAFAASFVVMIPVSLLQIAVPALTLLPYGKQFAGGSSVVQWLMLNLTLLGLFQPFGSILASRNKMWLGFGYNVTLAALLLASSMIFVPKYRGAGLAAVMALTYGTASLAWLAYYHVREKALLGNIRLAQCIIVALVSAGLCFAASQVLGPRCAGVVALAVIMVFLWYTSRLLDIPFDSLRRAHTNDS
jgi:O-antigen/teichoic acid export membrane protein